MKSIITSISALALIFSLSNCTAYVDADGTEASRTTTTRTTSADPYAPSSSVTTRQTTTRY